MENSVFSTFLFSLLPLMGRQKAIVMLEMLEESGCLCLEALCLRRDDKGHFHARRLSLSPPFLSFFLCSLLNFSPPGCPPLFSLPHLSRWACHLFSYAFPPQCHCVITLDPSSPHHPSISSIHFCFICPFTCQPPLLEVGPIIRRLVFFSSAPIFSPPPPHPPVTHTCSSAWTLQSFSQPSSSSSVSAYLIFSLESLFLQIISFKEPDFLVLLFLDQWLCVF